jgi:hypothetical protein
MRLSRFLSKHSTDAANIQESNSVNYFTLCGTIWKLRIFERNVIIPKSFLIIESKHSITSN